MNEFDDDRLRDLAPLIAFDAVDEVERARILREVSAADDAARRAFEAELAAARETLARFSDATATDPPPPLRGRILAALDEEAREDGAASVRQGARRHPRLRSAVVAAAAAVVLGVGGVIGYAVANRSEAPTPTQAEQVFAAPDVRTTTGAVAGGEATVTYSPSAGEGVLVMNDVPPPAPGSIYQMWLIGPDGPRLAGTMSDADVAPSTTAVITDMGGATAVAFTVGSAATPDKMVSDPVAQLPLR
ncbi:anti-sigma factor [Gordonia neofelifaecis]|uniref:Regulator of SigK n=1 Tax=Gordonia neofelifaecis NRRL B-59395 TaxID=644548 RepID=F1YM11_9ACTN|nr:anti-sigma factor [Gordonia neofelifaecis]EGD54262.1 anti-sigma-K factor RskA [Gordonia neofelifaecis NRRL B-59395]